MTLQTPQYPDGRDVVVIANDMTHKIGSFGPQEDLLFKVTAAVVPPETRAHGDVVLSVCLSECRMSLPLPSVIRRNVPFLRNCRNGCYVCLLLTFGA